LDLVGPVRLGTTQLVLDRKGYQPVLGVVQLDCVRHACKPQRHRAQRHCRHQPDTLAPLALGQVHRLVREPALGRKRVLCPHSLDVDERALARAEEMMLEGRKGNGLLLRPKAAFVHGY
jgi:hypothetical protein